MSKACGALAKIRHYVNTDILRNVYFALVNSYLRYGIVAWGNASVLSMNPLQVLTNRALRIMSFAPFGPIDTDPIYHYFRILDVDQTFSLEQGKFIFKSINDLLPISNIASHFDTERSIIRHNYSTRSRNNSMYTPIVPTEYLSSFAQKSISIKRHEVWASIPDQVKHSESYDCFKRNYKKFLLGDAA